MAKVKCIPGFRSERKEQVAAYIRVSTTSTKQDESYENQEAYFRKKIEANPEWELAGIYGDQQSGTKAENREGFQNLMKDAEDGKIDLILCKSVARWARNIVDGLNSIKVLTGKGVHICFEEEGIDTRMPGVSLQLNLAQAAAQSESESISENLKWNYDNRAARGIFWARKGIYYGYDTHGDSFTENEDSKYVRLIFEDYVAGMSIPDIAEKLNSTGVKNNRGRNWIYSSVRGILKNEVYVGDVVFFKSPRRNVITKEIDKNWKPKVMRNHHKGIVSRELWNKAQERLAIKKRNKNMETLTKTVGTMGRTEQIYELIIQGCGNIMAVARKLDLPSITVQYYLQRLEREGKIRNEEGVWLPEF